jgi:hypothetical protein
MAIQRRLHHPPLNSTTAPVNEAHFTKAGCRGRFDVFLDDRSDVGGRKGMQIDFVFDRNVTVISHQSQVISHPSSVTGHQSLSGSRRQPPSSIIRFAAMTADYD